MNLWSFALRRTFTRNFGRWKAQRAFIVGLCLSSSAVSSFHVYPASFLSPWSSSTNNHQCLRFFPLTTMSESSSASRKSARSAKSSAEDVEEENVENETAAKKSPAAKKKKAVAKKTATTANKGKKKNDDEKGKSADKLKAKAKSPAKRKKADDSDDEAVAGTPKKKRAKAPPHQRITEKDPLPKLFDPSKAAEGSYSKFPCVPSCHCLTQPPVHDTYLHVSLTLLVQSLLITRSCRVFCSFVNSI